VREGLSCGGLCSTQEAQEAGRAPISGPRNANADSSVTRPAAGERAATCVPPAETSAEQLSVGGGSSTGRGGAQPDPQLCSQQPPEKVRAT